MSAPPPLNNDEPTPALVDATQQASTGLVTPVSDRVLWVEVLVVLALAWVPNVYYAVVPFLWPDSDPPQSTARLNLSLSVTALQVSVPVLYLIWRSGEPWPLFGLVKPRLLVDALLGFAVYVVHEFAMLVSSLLAPNTDRVTAQWDAEVAGAAGVALVLVGQLTNAFGEELVLRGYLLARLERLCGSAVPAVLLTSLLFAAYHVYHGPRATLDVALTGLVFGAAVVLLRRLWPVVLAHALVNIPMYFRG